MPYQKTCQWTPCGKAFVTKEAKTKYCSSDCYSKAATKVRLPRRCAYSECGIDFNWARKEARYCSEECSAAARKKERAEARERLALNRAKKKYREKEDLALGEDYANMAKVFEAPVETAPFPEAEPRHFVIPDVPAPRGTGTADETIVFIPDVHVGDHDEKAVALALAVIKHVQPDRIIQLGDVLDMYGLSRFDKNPLRFAARVQYELDLQSELYRTITEIAPGALKQQILGNHCQRGIKMLWANPALADLRAMQLPQLMRLDELGWEPKMHEEIWLADGKFVVRHGTYIRRWSCYSAKAELDSTLVSGISGHSHRAGIYSLSSPAGELSWTEAGCLQKNPPEWRTSFQNWQHAVVIGEFERGGNSFSIDLIRFRASYKCRVGRMELSA